MGLLREMRWQGPTPDVISYNAAIIACEKGLQWAQAVALLREMGWQGLTYNAISYNAAISAW